jgi:hypothetical protein
MFNYVVSNDTAYDAPHRSDEYYICVKGDVVVLYETDSVEDVITVYLFVLRMDVVDGRIESFARRVSCTEKTR